MNIKTINGREAYECDICHIIGFEKSVIEKGFCHRRTSGSHSGNKTADKKLEQKYKVKGMSRISVAKFNELL